MDEESNEFQFRIENGNVTVRCSSIPGSRDIYVAFLREGRQFFRYRFTEAETEQLFLNMDWARA